MPTYAALTKTPLPLPFDCLDAGVPSISSPRKASWASSASNPRKGANSMGLDSADTISHGLTGELSNLEGPSKDIWEDC